METDNQQNVTQKKSYAFVEIVKFLILSAIIVIPIRIFIAEPFIVSGSSMDPTFEHGEYLIVDELTYHFEKPKRGDVVIFKYPAEPSKYFIKRIVGLPQERVAIKSGEIFIYNTEWPDGRRLDEPYLKDHDNSQTDLTLSEDEYYVLGDNRSHSFDSRAWGPVPEKNIIGKPFIRLFPVTEIKLFPGSIN